MGLGAIWLAVAWCGLGAPAPATAREAGLPQRNLLVEWRLSGQGQAQQREAGVRAGQVIVDSRHGVIGRGEVRLSSTESEGQMQSVQQVSVLNGGRARIFVGRSEPYTTWQWAWGGPAGQGGLGVIGPLVGANATGGGAGTGTGAGTGSGQVGGASGREGARAQVWSQTGWIDLGQGLNVRPSWTGGRAPVTVELEAQSRTVLGAGDSRSGRIEADGSLRHSEVASTLSVPLGEWTVVARSGSTNLRQQSGNLSTRELEAGESEQLEIRITAP